MTEYICNAAGKVAYCAKCLTAKPHECRPLNYFHCSEVGGSVRCDLIEETHTCYYCNHEGPCVNRIHSTEFTAWGRTQEIRYVCDDGDACDERWQALQESDCEITKEDRLWDWVGDLSQRIHALENPDESPS
ncbi:hypothetical protein LCGC14_3020020 [marine sediment metagenome]|uniref:Uncharacterized protein n=1 Tax=marine sediment metagenome TaxID=412755 RepID=A0A0F8Z386_9ZZZZ